MYEYVIDCMTWSYSRLKAFEGCPYRFFLKYIYECDGYEELFFASYGSFMHDILAKFYSNRLSKDALVPYYLNHFFDEVRGQPPSEAVYSGFFDSGLRHMKSVVIPDGRIIGVEKRVRFCMDGYPFVGYIDLIVMRADGQIEIWDHKSHPLAQRSGKRNPTKADAELDGYLRQLYLYSIPVIDQFGVEPSHLVFNCYRKGTVVREPFRKEGLEEAKAWAASVIRHIREASEFLPSIEYFKCRYLCDAQKECEYYGMSP